MKKRTIILSISTIISMLTFPVHANEILRDDSTYRIVDVDTKGELTLIKEYQDYDGAYTQYQQLLNQYDNLCLTLGDDYIEAETALVSFHRSNSCDVNVEYQNVTTQTGGYTNGCYACDGAYLSSDSSNVTFKLSGVQGQTSIDQVDIIPFATHRVSYYIVKQQRLYHYIKTNVNEAGYGNILSLGKAPSFLQEDIPYYSYDGHYFYQDYAIMIEDYRKNTYKHALNQDSPYYNYYQYISHRTSSNYTYEDLSNAWQSAFGMNQTMTSFKHDGSYTHLNLNESLLLQGSDAFFQYQNQYGVNAMMMLSLAMNESSYGRSALAFSRNNLFGHAAYDEDVDSNATGYRKVSESIYYHANSYISQSYLNPDNFTYHGAQFGNKAGGLNVSYASDPYWGEKAAQFYLNIDESLGSKDYEAYRIGVAYQKAVAIKKEASSSSTTLYQSKQFQETSFVILNEIENEEGLWYQVASDIPSLENNENRIYDFTKSVGYIKASDLDYASSNSNSAKEYVNIHFDAGEGSYHPNQSIVTLSVEKNHIPTVTAPELPQYHFVGYQEEITPATTETTYHAKYLKIDSIDFIGLVQSEYYIGEYLNLNNVKLRITCGEEVFDIPLTTDYVSGFSSRSVGDYEMVVTYGGKQIALPYEVKEEKDTEKGQYNQIANEIIAEYEKDKSLSEESIKNATKFIQNLRTTSGNILDIQKIRYIDRILETYRTTRLSVILKDSKYDLQVSGLSFQDIPHSILTNYVPITLQIELQSIQHPQQTTIENAVATNYYNLEDVFEVSYKADFTSFKPILPMVYSLQKPENHENKLYRVIEITEDGGLIQVPSEQSKERITFQSKGSTFALVSISQDGIIDTFDFTEVYHQGREMKNYISLISTIAISGGIVFIVVIGAIIFFIIKRKKK